MLIGRKLLLLEINLIKKINHKAVFDRIEAGTYLVAVYSFLKKLKLIRSFQN